MKGLDRNVAISSWVGKIAEDDAQLLKILWKAGCVFYVRTTEPQTLVRSSKHAYSHHYFPTKGVSVHASLESFELHEKQRSRGFG